MPRGPLAVVVVVVFMVPGALAGFLHFRNTSHRQVTPEMPPVILPPGSVVIECESMSGVQAPWETRSDPAAADGLCLEFPDGAGKPPQVTAMAAADVLITQPGQYRCWVRSWWQDACGNSISVRIGGGLPVTVGQDAVYWRWHWVALDTPLRLEPGQVRVELHNREDGVRLDQVLLCPDPAFVPQGSIQSGRLVGTEGCCFADDFLRSPETPNPGWEWDRQWFRIESVLDPNGTPLQATLKAQGLGLHAAIVGAPDWREYRVEVSLRVDQPGSVGLVSHANPRSAILLRWSPGAADQPEAGVLSLVFRRGKRHSILARCPLRLSPHQWYRFALDVDRTQLRGGVDGNDVLSAASPRLEPGRSGVEVEDAVVHFDDFSVQPSGAGRPVRPLEMDTFTSAKVTRSVFDDFTDAETKRMDQGTDRDLLRREEQFYTVIGEDPNQSRFTPGSGTWEVAQGCLTVTGATPAARLVRNRPLLGDVAVSVRVRLQEQGSAAGVLIEASPREAGHLVLLRRGQIELLPENGAPQRLTAAVADAGRWHEMTVRRITDTIEVTVDSVPVGTFHGVSRGTGLSAGLAATGGTASFDDLRFSVLNGGDSRFYAFDRPEPDWAGTTDAWGIHTGIACKDASHWVTCRAPPEGAVLWNKNRFSPAALSLAAHVFEHTTWYGWEKEESHEHHVYAGLGFLIASDGTGVASGYAALINPVTRGRTLLFRNGEIVAEAKPGQLPLVYAEGHVPVAPRGSLICLRKNGSHVQLVVNGTTVFDWTDPTPLTGGHAAIFATEGMSNWSDVSVVSERREKSARFWPGAPPLADVAVLLRR